MATKPNLGAKRHCLSCGARFYDLGKNPAQCPKCGYFHDIRTPMKARRGRGKAAVEPVAEEVKKAVRPPVKSKKPVRQIEGVSLDGFEDVETADGDEEIEEIEEIEDVDSLEALEDIEPDDDDKDEKIEAPIPLKKGAKVGTVLIDEIEEEDEEDEEDEDEDEDEEEERKARPGSNARPASKAKAKSSSKAVKSRPKGGKAGSAGKGKAKKSKR